MIQQGRLSLLHYIPPKSLEHVAPNWLMALGEISSLYFPLNFELINIDRDL